MPSNANLNTTTSRLFSGERGPSSILSFTFISENDATAIWAAKSYPSVSFTGSFAALAVQMEEAVASLTMGFTQSASAKVIHLAVSSLSSSFTSTATATSGSIAGEDENGVASLSVGFTVTATATEGIENGVASLSFGFTTTASAGAGSVESGVASLSVGFTTTASAKVSHLASSNLSVGFTTTASATAGGIEAGVANLSVGFTTTASAKVSHLAIATLSTGFTTTASAGAGAVESGVASLTFGFTTTASATEGSVENGVASLSFGATVTANGESSKLGSASLSVSMTVSAAPMGWGNYSLNMDGVDQQVSVPISTSTLEDDFSIAMWMISGSDADGAGVIFGDGYVASDGRNGWRLYKTSDNKLNLWTKTSADVYDNPIASIDSGMGDDEWAHIMLSRNGSTFKIHIDGSALSLSAGSPNNNPTLSMSHTSPAFKVFNNSIGVPNTILGNLDQLAIWDSDQSSNIAQIYDGSGYVVDVSSLSPVGLWEFENNPNDSAGSNNATLDNDPTYSVGTPPRND